LLIERDPFDLMTFVSLEETKEPLNLRLLVANIHKSVLSPVILS